MPDHPHPDAAGRLGDIQHEVDAERRAVGPLLLAGYGGMKQREMTIPPRGEMRISEAIERLLQPFEATDKKDEAAKWRKNLESQAGGQGERVHEVGQA